MPQTICDLGLRRSTYQGDTVALKVAILQPGVLSKTFTDQTVTVATGGGAKGATAIPVTATTEDMYVGQALAFVDSDGKETIAQLSEDALVGATSLTVFPLPEAVPEAATAEFPAKVVERSGVNFSDSANVAETQTGDSGGNTRSIISGFAARTITADGIETDYNAGLKTCRYAYRNRQQVYGRIEYPAPNANYLKGKQIYGVFHVNSMAIDASADAQITAPVELTSDGGICEIDPTET